MQLLNGPGVTTFTTMKRIFINQLFSLPTLFLSRLLALVWLTVPVMSSPVSAQEKPKDPRSWSNLSEEEQKKLKEALRTVWSDPTVLSARESVNRSAQEYQLAVREMIKKQNPETAILLDKVQKSQPPGMMQMFLGEVHGTKRPMHGFGLTPPPMMERMNETQRARFKEAETKAKMRPEVVAAMEELKTLSQEDEEIRRKKMEAFRKLRQAHFEAMMEIDPELKEFLPPPGSPPGKSKNPKKGPSDVIEQSPAN
jgi:hypothetical protein